MNVSQLISMTFKAAVDRFIMKKLCINHEKTKTTFTKPGTVCEGGLRIYCGFHSCWCFYAFFFSVFVSFWYDNFVFIYLLIFFLFRHQYLLLLFVHLFVCLFFQSFLSFNLKISTSVLKCYTPAVLMHFAITPKGHTIVHVNMDLLEMDENVKVNVGVEI